MSALWRRPALLLALIVSGALVLIALFAPWLAPHDPIAGVLTDRLLPPAWTHGGVAAHPLGTDVLGRDILSRLFYGARVSLIVCALAIAIAGCVGSVLGILAGFLGGWLDTLIMRLVDLAISLPVILLALLFGVLFGPGLGNIVVIVSLVLWSQFARMARGETLRVKSYDYIDLARSAGCSRFRIMLDHVLPNVAAPLIVLATLQVGTVIILEASLSFLGVGVPPPTPSWGSMVAEGRSYVVSAWWLCIFPGLAMVLTVLSINIVGDNLTDVLDPARRRPRGA